MSPPTPREPHVDFDRLKEALLQRADTLVPLWLPAGHKNNGRWYVGDFDGSEGKSANVSLKTGTWIDNGRPGDKGRDLISLYGRIHGLSNLAAARQLMRDEGWAQAPVRPPPSPKAAKKKSDVEWTPIHPVPPGAPPYRSQWGHYAYGVPTQHWEYLDRAGLLLGVVCRFDKPNGEKEVLPLSFCQGSNGKREWRYKAFTQPRPLYGLQRLPADVVGQLVIVCEGEKKSDRLFEALGSCIPVLGWPGGCKVVQLADWRPLAGANVVCWPDADSQRDKLSSQLLPAHKQPGLDAMLKVRGILSALGTAVRVVDVGPPGTRPEGWDAADAIAEGWTRDQLLAFMGSNWVEQTADAPPPGTADAAHAAPVAATASAPTDGPADGPTDGPTDGPLGPEPPPAPAPAGGGSGGRGGRSTPSTAGAGDDDGAWRDDYIVAKGSVRECVPNVMLVMHNHPAWKGVLGFDQFSQRVVKCRAAPFDPPSDTGGEWADVDDTRAAAWIARNEGWVPNSGMIAEAATEVAHAHAFHPVLQYLRGLQHDGVKRMDHWMVDLLHVKDTPYARLVSRYFLIGMCMRVLHPGVKFDYCLVLEGLQGRRKSSALRALGGEWFSDIELDLANKDAMSNIRGKWLHEFGEMGSLARSESSRQKSFLSRQIDEFRPTYGRREIRCPRQTAFAGSTNEWAWNKDPTGGRRFWPLEVGDMINVDGLVAIRDQLFAEAFAAAQAGERYWPDSVEQAELFDPEQLSRESPDAYVEMLGTWIDTDPVQRSEFTLSTACIEGLKLDARSLTKDIQTRVGIALRKLGCERVERRNAVNRFVYKRPQRIAASSTDHATAETAAEVPF